MLGFIRGVILGGVVAGAGLVALSQLAPPPDGQSPEAGAAPATAEVAANQTPDEPAPEAASESGPAEPDALAEPDTLAEPVPAEEDDPLLSPSSGVETLPEPMADPAPQAGSTLPQITPPETAPEAGADVPSASTQAATPQTTDAPALLGTAPAGLDGTADKVVVGRLPTIAPPELTPEAMAEPATDPAADTLAPAEAAPTDTRPVALYASTAMVVPDKPLFSILLEDTGEDVDRRALAESGLPLGIVIDPLADGATARAAEWRSLGVEVIMSAAALPAGATPADIEQNLQVMADKLPEAVAVMDVTGESFQNNRARATQVAEVLAAQGRGLITLDQGVNSADQVAQRSGLESAVVFRRFDVDADGRPVTGPAVKRALGRAVDKASREGSVVVIGTLRGDTISGLLEWAIEGRAATVAVAPVTRVMGLQ